MSIVLKVILLQVIVGIIVLFVLRRLLDRELLLLALEHLQHRAKVDRDLAEVTVCVARKFPADLEFRFRTVLKEKFPTAEVTIVVSAEIWGGLVIKAGAELIDCSMLGRVKQIFRRDV